MPNKAICVSILIVVMMPVMPVMVVVLVVLVMFGLFVFAGRTTVFAVHAPIAVIGAA